MFGRGSHYAIRWTAYAAPVLALLLVVAAAGDGASARVSGSQASARDNALTGKIDPQVLRDIADTGSADFIVLMADKADLNRASAMPDHDARGWYVYNTLSSHAQRSQAGVRAALDAVGVQYKSYWIANALAVSGDRALVESLAARADVRKIESDRPSQAIQPIVEQSSSGDRPAAVEWGVQRVNAPQMWAMGHTGEGIVVGNQDTGMRWTHNAIKNQYRGWNGSTAQHNYNWWDGTRVGPPGVNPCGYAANEPCDDDDLLGGGHGTHTTGTAVGGDGGSNQVGVAPEAEWIGCRNMDRGVGRPQTYLECFEFFLAPHDLTEQNPNPAVRPHVMNNSWACLEGCAPTTLQAAVEASVAAGIFVEASAGNDGPGCSTVAWTPALYEKSFTTGAMDISNTLAEFSSRGPVAADGSLRIKPDITAPGVDVRSALRGSDTEYDILSGTSMAGPHVVGVVALLWSSRPDLVRQIEETRYLLERSANPDVTPFIEVSCGTTPHTQIPNNTFGWGRVDALAALNLAQSTQATFHANWESRPAQPHPAQQLPISIQIKSGATERSYPGLTTDQDGEVGISVNTLPAGTYNWRAKGPKFLANAGSATIGAEAYIEMGVMRAGDANDDNVVEAVDFNILKGTFGRLHTDPGYDDRADFTGDQVINIDDFNALRANFGHMGAPPLSPEGE